MTTHKSSGGCHCGNILFEIETANELSSYNPRACDCEFCSKHGASYISDKNGKLIISVKNDSDLIKYKQGSEIADFLLCKKCGVLVAVCYEEQDQVYGSINSKAINANVEFGDELSISPKQFTDKVKVERWKDNWFSGVRVKYVKESRN